MPKDISNPPVEEGKGHTEVEDDTTLDAKEPEVEAPGVEPEPDTVPMVESWVVTHAMVGAWPEGTVVDKDAFTEKYGEAAWKRLVDIGAVGPTYVPAEG